jgi:dTDP-4-dehydrorhamnose reductase
VQILLLGHTGQLGWELHRELLPLGPIDVADLPREDLVRPETLVRLMRELRPDLLVNAMAYTAVDRAEIEPEQAQAANVRAPGILAEECRRLKAALIHYSTDYVFDGKTSRPYREDDDVAPINTYGRTKLEGEAAVRGVGGSFLILRTSWLYGFRRMSFPLKILELARSQRVMRVVSDQVGSPTWCRTLAQLIARSLATGARDVAPWIRDRAGIYHLAGSGQASRFEWARAVLELDPRPEEQIVETVEPAAAAEFPGGAARPSFSALDCTHFNEVFGFELPAWPVTLRLAMDARPSASPTQGRRG